MKSFNEFIKQAESGTTKQVKLSALSDLSDIAKILITEALNPYRVFGVKKYPAPTSFASVDPDEGQEFIILLDYLHERKLTGNAARDQVVAVLSKYTKETAANLARVLNKDLKVGMSETTVNKVYPNLVPVFDVMLAQKLEPDMELEFPVLASTKCDGERTIAICENGVVSYFSRSGKEATHIAGLFDDDMRAIENYLGYPVVVDGERYAGDFTTTMNAKKSGNDGAKAAMRLMAFDYMSLNNWKQQIAIPTQKDREKNLMDMLNKLKLQKIVMMPGKLVNNRDEMMDEYQEAVKMGFEGLIIKKLDGKYEWGRSKNWLKLKPIIDVDLMVTGCYEGRPGSKYVGMLGGLMCEGHDENGKFIITDVGSGFNDELRKEIWDNQDKYIGRTVQLQCQEICKAEGSDAYSLRFPVFQKWRDDK